MTAVVINVTTSFLWDVIVMGLFAREIFSCLAFVGEVERECHGGKHHEVLWIKELQEEACRSAYCYEDEDDF